MRLNKLVVIRGALNIAGLSLHGSLITMNWLARVDKVPIQIRRICWQDRCEAEATPRHRAPNTPISRSAPCKRGGTCGLWFAPSAGDEREILPYRSMTQPGTLWRTSVMWRQPS